MFWIAIAVVLSNVHAMMIGRVCHATLPTAPYGIIATGKDFVQCQMFARVILDILGKIVMPARQIIDK